MQPKIFEGNSEEQWLILKPVYLKLSNVNGAPVLEARNEFNEVICELLLFGEEQVQARHSAKDTLKSYGYDTSFAEWNADGQIILEY